MKSHTVRGLLNQAAKKIVILDAETLLAAALKRDRSFLFAHPEFVVQPAAAKKFLRFAAARARFMPLHYILGEREFYGRAFKLKPPILIPRPETEALVEIALATVGDGANEQGARVFDIGCGTGAIGITLACERKNAKIFLNDVDPAAVALAKQNAKKLLRASGMTRVKIKNGSLLEPWKKEFAAASHARAEYKSAAQIFIVANLPYLSQKQWHGAEPQVKKFESKRALLGGGADGLNAYRALFTQIAALPERVQKNIKLIALELEPEQVKPIKKFAQKILKRNFGILRHNLNPNSPGKQIKTLAFFC